MHKKGLELPLSTIIVILILLLFLFVAFVIITGWGEDSKGLLDGFFRLFRR